MLLISPYVGRLVSWIVYLDGHLFSSVCRGSGGVWVLSEGKGGEKEKGELGASIFIHTRIRV